MSLPWWLSMESACNMGGLGSIPGLGRSSGKGKGYPLQYSGLENSWTVCKAGPGAMMGRPSSPSHRWGKSLTEGASQIPGTNDSTLRQLKPPHPSHIEGPISPRRLSLVTYPNPRPSSLTTPHNECIKATPNMIWARTSLTCLARVWEPCLGVLCH